MSAVPVSQPLTAPAGADGDTGTGARRPRPTNPQIYWLIIVGALAIGGLSLLIPSTPSYDPWAWIVWGREILHGTLHTPGGPTWKPLPVIFTTIFAIFGRAAPDLWLVVARAAAIVACLMTGKLAFRITDWLAQGVSARAAGTAAAGTAATAAAPNGSASPANGTVTEAAAGSDLTSQVARLLPGLLAAVAAIVGLALSSNFLSSSALGYSEGLAIAALMIAVERHLDGHRRQAFALGFIAALDRPEVWIFWGPYGLWLMWKDPGARALVIGLAIATLVLWFVPQKWGGGSFTSGVARAQHPRANSPAFAKCPFCTEFKDDAWPKVMLRTKVAAILALLAAVGLLLRGWRLVSKRAVGISVLGFNPKSIRLTTPRQRALALIAGAGILGFGWWVIISIETQAGFSGNTRYIVIGSAFVYLCGSVGFGWAAVELAALIRRWRAPGPAATSPSQGATQPRPRVSARLASSLTAGLLALIFVFVPHWVGSSLINISETHKSLAFQAGLRSSLVQLIDEAGGVNKLKACGQGNVMVEGFQVPMVAWYFDGRTLDVEDQPTTPASGIAPKPWPNVIFQDRDTGNLAQPVLPLWTTVNGWIADGAKYTERTAKEMRFFEDCASQPNDHTQQWPS
jgi:hypothetical protein